MTASKGNDEGVVILIAPTGGVTYGSVQKIGATVCMALGTIAATATGSFMYRGLIHNATKVGSQAIAAGALVYWDAGNTRFTTSATGNTKAGIAATATGSGAGETLIDILLTGVI